MRRACVRPCEFHTVVSYWDKLRLHTDVGGVVVVACGT